MKGARLIGLSNPSFYNPRLEQAEIDPRNTNRVHFKAITRGSSKSILLELEGANAGTSVEVTLIPNRERPTTRATFRRRAELPGETFTLSFKDIPNGWVVHRLRAVDRYVDGSHDDPLLAEVAPVAPAEVGQQLELRRRLMGDPEVEALGEGHFVFEARSLPAC